MINATNPTEAAKKVELMADFHVDDIVRVIKPCNIEGIFPSDDYSRYKFDKYYNYKNW